MIPSSLTQDSDPIAFSEDKRFRTVEANGTDRNAYLDSDVPVDSKITAGHGHIYITGNIAAGCSLMGRQCLFSAGQIDATTRVSNGLLLIVNDTNDEMVFKKIGKQYDAPAILVVPEAKRAEIFDTFAPIIRSDLDQPPTRSLRSVKQAFPDVLMKLFYCGTELDMPTSNRGEPNQR